MNCAFVGIVRDRAVPLDVAAWGASIEALRRRCSGEAETIQFGNLLIGIRGATSRCLEIRENSSLVLMDGFPQLAGSQRNISSVRVEQASLLGLGRPGSDPLELVKRMWGGYALVHYVQEDARILLNTDRFGLKPLYYVKTRMGIAFSTCLRSLVAILPEPSVDPEAMVDVLGFRMLSGRTTLIQSVRQVEPGTLVELGESGVSRIRRYWRLAFPRELQEPGKPKEFWKRQTLDALRGAVSAICDGQRHINVFLSGGVDSTILAALVAERSPRVAALTLEIEGFANPELERAAKVAAQLGLRHEIVRVTEADVRENHRWLVRHLDHPPRHINNLALIALYRRAAELGGPVVSGVAADAFFGASEPRLVRVLEARGRLRRLIGRPIAGVLGFLLNSFVRNGRLVRLADALRYDVEIRCLRLERLEFNRIGEELVSNCTGGIVASSDLMESVWESDDDLVSRTRRLHLFLLSRSEFVRNDRIGAALGVETMYPFLSSEVFEVAQRMPDEMQYDGEVSKPVLREICAELVSPEIAYWSKMGFPSPTAEWLRGPLAEDLARLAAPDPVIDRIVPSKKRAQLEPESEFELLWTLLNLAQIAGDMGLRLGGVEGSRGIGRDS